MKLSNIEKQLKHKKLILFDGVCNLCNTSIQYVIQRDKNNQFLFAPLQSNIGKQLIDAYNIDIVKTDSILLFTPQKGISYKSTAALKIATHLGFPAKLLGIFIVLPIPLRDYVYSYIAKNRYRWFGKKNECMIPTPELRNKFLD